MLPLINRITFGIKEALKHRTALKAYRADEISDVIELTIDSLKAKNIRLLALDFDGVLASHGEVEVAPEVATWLNEMVQGWGAENIVVYSNKPFKERIDAFQKNWPVEFYVGAKKPYPDGLSTLAQKYKVAPSAVLLVDDRLLTGVLAAHLAGTKVLWVKKPRANYSKRPIHERFFHMLRVTEDKWLG